MNTVGRPGNRNCAGLLTVMALVFALGVIFSAAAFGQGRASSGSAIDAAQMQRIEQLYAEDADAWSRHDIAKIVSFFDPSLIIVSPDGTLTSYAEWRRNLPASLAAPKFALAKLRFTVKAVQELGDGFVASVASEESYKIYDTKRSAWIPMISSFRQENTWRSDGRGNFRIVFVKFLPNEGTEGAFGQGRASSGSAIDAAQMQRILQLYAEDADAWSRHDIAKIVSFFDPSLVVVAPDGTLTSYAEWRRNLPASLAEPKFALTKLRFTVKAVQELDDGFVASVESEESYKIYDTKRSAWIPMISSFRQENTWKSDGRGNFRIVVVKFLPNEGTAGLNAGLMHAGRTWVYLTVLGGVVRRNSGAMLGPAPH
ncbi:MAG: nuclear transport factor 2 family protein [Chloracidobacterium sp.]|nr:nuclear transport factor 2 family protein [Chloracidobacterium sp.]